jgi:hypothetical protein
MRLGENPACAGAASKLDEESDSDEPPGGSENEETESVVARLMRSHRRCIYCGAELLDNVSHCNFCGAAS